MPIIRDGAYAEDNWVLLDTEDDIPGEGDVVLPLDRALQQLDGLGAHNGRVGLSIPNDAEIEPLTEVVNRVDLVLLHLPSFTDGRAYSQARVLREEAGFVGELRLKGDVLADQAAFLKRCGFDSFEPDTAPDLAVWNDSLKAVSTSYQSGYRDTLQKRSS